MRFGVVSTLAVILCLYGGSVTLAGSDCVDADFSGMITQAVPGGVAEGDVEMVIDGIVRTAHMSVTIVRAKATEDGTQETDWEVTWDLGDGDSFSSLIHGVLSPVEGLVFRANAQGKITEGTGEFETTLGKMVIHGRFEVLLTPVFSEFDGRGRGKLCDIKL